MKRILTIIGLFSLLSLHAQDSARFAVPIGKYNMHVVARSNFYPTYLADPLGIRFSTSSQYMQYSDVDHSDMVNEDGSYVGKLVIIPATRFSLFKFVSKENPNLGFEVDLGFTIPVYMRMGNHDLIGMDGIFYFAIGGKPAEWLALRFAKHHICTHIGEEFPDWIHSPTDYDYNLFQLPVKDEFKLSAAVKPLYFLHSESLNILQVYGDFGFYVPGKDFIGTRQNKPNTEAYFSFQGGTELEYYFPNKYFGGVFGALNVSSFQQNAFAPNISGSIGYIVPQERNFRRVRIGLNYYNGRPWSNQVYNRKEKFIAFFVEMDV